MTNLSITVFLFPTPMKHQSLHNRLDTVETNIILASGLDELLMADYPERAKLEKARRQIEKARVAIKAAMAIVATIS